MWEGLEAVRYKDKIIMDSVRENLCFKTGVEHCVMPILIHEVGKSWNTGLGQPYSTQ